MNLGENIKKLREFKNFTQQYLADELGLSLSGYGKIERDQTELTINRLLKICEILEVDLFTLINFDHKSVFQNLNAKSNGTEEKTRNCKENQELQQLLIHNTTLRS